LAERVVGTKKRSAHRQVYSYCWVVYLALKIHILESLDKNKSLVVDLAENILKRSLDSTLNFRNFSLAGIERNMLINRRS